MQAKKFLLTILMVGMVSPGFPVESMYLDEVPITYPGDYLAPPNFYSIVPPPSWTAADSMGSLVPSTLYDYNIIGTPTTARYTPYTAGAAASALDSDPSDTKLRVCIKAGLDNASDVPLTVINDHFARLENMKLVDEGDTYDVLVEVETMKLASTGTVFVIINAYKDVNGESLIFYNTFGYLGELKLLSGSTDYAINLENALESEADIQPQAADDPAVQQADIITR